MVSYICLLYDLLLTSFACAVVDFRGEAAYSVFHLHMVRAVIDVPAEQVDDVICLHDSPYIAYRRGFAWAVTDVRTEPVDVIRLHDGL